MKKQCFIVGGGPSLTDFDWSLLDGKITIAINNAYKVLPNASICYFTDNDWWELHKEDLLKHPGIKIKGSLPNSFITHPRVKEYTLTNATGIETQAKSLAHGYNSVYAAINLAAIHLSFTEIFLLGVDMGWVDGKSHWHTDHQRVDQPTVYDMMMDAFTTIAHPLWDRGVVVTNLNPQSRLDVFPKLDYNVVLGSCKNSDSNP